MISAPQFHSLFSQPTIANCPEWSICLEVDEENCTIEIRLQGIENVPILGVNMTIFFNPGSPLIRINDTRSSFEASDIFNYFDNSPFTDLSVQNNFVSIAYTAFNLPNPLQPYVSDENCILLGTIYFDQGELGCKDVMSLIDYNLSGNSVSGGPTLYVGSDYFWDLTVCDNFNLDCTCCPNDWGLCFLPDPSPCGNVISVFLTGLSLESISGYRFQIVLDPDIEIDEEATKTSWLASKIGDHNWEFKDLSITNAVNGTFVNVQAFNTNPGNNYLIFDDEEFLMNIYIVPEIGECYEFDEESISFFNPSGIFLGESIAEGKLCDNFDLTCNGFEVCFDNTVILSGTIERPTSGSACIEAIDYGFPEGKVTAYGIDCGGGIVEFSGLTQTNGNYEIEVLADVEYRVVPSYTDEHKYACGVNSIDLNIVQQEILLGNGFLLPFANFAADLSLDGLVTTNDLNLINRYILEIQYPFAGKWRFLPDVQYNSLFAPQDPVGIVVPGYDTMQVVTAANNINNLNFIAIKMGDVNGSCTHCLNSSTLQDDDPLLLVKGKYDPSIGEIGIYLNEYQDLSVSMVNLVIDGGKGIEFASNVNQQVFMGDGVMFSKNKENKIYTSWISSNKNGKTIGKGDRLLTLKVDDFIYFMDVTLEFGELVADNQLYKLDIDLTKFEIINESIVHFDDLTIAPNPGRDEVVISIGNIDGLVELLIVDQLGRQISAYQIGGYESLINTSILRPGVYNFIFTSSNIRESRTWIKAE